MIRVITI